MLPIMMGQGTQLPISDEDFGDYLKILVGDDLQKELRDTKVYISNLTFMDSATGSIIAKISAAKWIDDAVIEGITRAVNTNPR